MSGGRDINLSMPPIPMAAAIPISTPSAAGSASSLSAVSIIKVNDSATLTQEQVSQLQDQGFPQGLAAELGRTRATYPVRFWVVDNSGSMQTADGHELRAHNTKDIQISPCTRWTELQGALTYHVQLAGLLETATIFRMLNNPGKVVGPQAFKVGDTGVSIADQVDQAMQVIQKATPRGVTPLTQHLEEIKMHISTMEESLREKGQEAVVVLATDGLPSNSYGESSEAVLKEFLLALKAVQSLPVWLVIRLCTDDEKVVSYYNGLDNELELPLEVIDDYVGESEEIHRANRWLNYGLPLHRCREMGYHHRIFDLLDERLLNKDELLEFVKLLFGPTHPWPDPHSQWKEFLNEVEAVMEVEAKQFNPKTQKMEPWIDVRQLKKAYGGTGGLRLFGKRK